MGAWIEINLIRIESMSEAESHPSWVRGLK